MPIPTHLGSTKTLSLGTQNGDYCKMPTLKLKITKTQERANLSSSLQDCSKIIGYVQIKPKLSPHSMGRIVYIPDTLISKVRQPPNIGGYQVSNLNSGQERSHH